MEAVLSSFMLLLTYNSICQQNRTAADKSRTFSKGTEISGKNLKILPPYKWHVYSKEESLVKL
jgi:hypothetical protein